MVLRSAVAILALLATQSVAGAQSGKALPKEDVRVTCQKEVDAKNPPGSLSNKRGNARQYLVDECIQKRSASR
jgi:hypothetical protein